MTARNGRTTTTLLLLVLGLVLTSREAFAARQVARDVAAEPAPAPAAAAPSLDFDLLADTPSAALDVPKVDLAQEALLKQRRLMLNVHQTVGMVLAATMLGAMVTGQLNYNDKFLGDNSGRYRLPHQLFVYPTEVFATTDAALALLTPNPLDVQSVGFDRIMLHKIGQWTAYAGWLAELALGLITVNREGYVNQKALATAHLAIGYVTFAGIAVGVGSIVF